MTLLKFLTPLNIPEERKKFFELYSTGYNPVFHYIWQDDISKLPSNERQKELVEAVISQSPNISDIAMRFYKYTFDSDTNIKAENAIKFKPTINKVRTNEVVEGLESALEFLGIDYKIVLTEREGFGVRPDHINKRLSVSTSIDLELYSLDSIIKHEIAHVIRAVNGNYNQISKSDYYIGTEEGFASFLGDFHSLNGHGSYFQHALDYLAAQVAIKSSFIELFQFYKTNGLSENLAWQRTVKNKIGFINTSTYGSIMKPAMYFYYESKIEQLKSTDIEKLFVGKINLDELSKVHEYSGCINLSRIKEFYNL